MNPLKIGIVLVACLLTCMALFTQAGAKVASSLNLQTTLGNDEDTFTFVGQCPNGERYRLVSYQVNTVDSNQSFYDYEGPVGKGTVRTGASPKTMSVRVCRKLAEIVNQNYWE
jgi:hypothetical protein